MNTQEQTIKAILAYVKNRTRRFKKNQDIIKKQIESATTETARKRWENELQRNIGSLQTLDMVDDTLWLFLAHPETLNGLQK